MKKAVIISTAIVMALAQASFAEDSARFTPVVKVVKECAGSVVNIATEKVVLLQADPSWQHYRQFFGETLGAQAVTRPIGTLKLKGLGSGVIVSEDGLIVTNAHVINMASKVYVILNDGTNFEAETAAIDQKNDLALIKITTDRELKPIEFAGDVMVGETAVSIGNPFGLENSVSSGVISGTKRKFISGSVNNVVFDDLIQTDASINEGSSGGALLNLDGKLVGINLALIQNAQNVAFAIPASKVRSLLKEYDNYKRQRKTIRIPIQ